MEKEIIIAVSVFLAVYGLLIWDKVDRAVIAILGASMLMVAGVLTQENAILGIDFNTIGLLVGMMVIVGISQKTGMFQYLAIKSVKLAEGDPWRILLYLAIVTASLSAFLDNVTTVLLIAPITLLITDELEVTPYPFLYSQIFASNIGGAATLIGDPPNIMIGSAKGLTFMDFVVNLGPLMAIVLAATLVVFKLVYGKKLVVEEENKRRVMSFREEDAIADVALLKKSLVVLGAVVAGLIVHVVPPATTALLGAAVLILISKENLHHVMEKVEWTTIFFFIGLFIIVHGLVEVGFIKTLADKILSITGGDLEKTAHYTLWLSGILSAIMDNIPYTATMIPLITGMEPHMGGSLSSLPVWWALSAGACLGGNGTIIGASANVIVAGFASRSGYPISFLRFALMAFPLMLMSLAISHVYIALVYF